MLTQSFVNCAAFLQSLLQVLLEQGQTLFKAAATENDGKGVWHPPALRRLVYQGELARRAGAWLHFAASVPAASAVQPTKGWFCGSGAPAGLFQIVRSLCQGMLISGSHFPARLTWDSESSDTQRGPVGVAE